MADSYSLMPSIFGSGADQYKKNGQDSDQNAQQSQLFKALLQQSMQQGTPNSGFGMMGHMLSQYMMMKGMQPQSLTVSGSPGMVSAPMSNPVLPMPGYTSPTD